MKIENRTFIVSGGSSGLGLATAKDLLELKAYISILDLSPSPADLPATHVKFIQTNISVVEEVQSAVDATVAWTAETGAPLGGVINCAGVASASRTVDNRGLAHPVSPWELSIAVNLNGSFHLTRLALEHLIKVQPEDTPDKERGVIIFVSSSAAYEGQIGQIAYSASKGALRSMTLPMARDLALHAIRVVSIAPGPFDTSMTKPMPTEARRKLESQGIAYPRRFGFPEEFAKTVRWILDCSFVNGETIRLSGAGRLPARM